MAGALLLSERVLRRAKLAQPEGDGIGAGWRGLRLARLAVQRGGGEGGKLGGGVVVVEYINDWPFGEVMCG